jgi:hypothetical protein
MFFNNRRLTNVIRVTTVFAILLYFFAFSIVTVALSVQTSDEAAVKPASYVVTEKNYLSEATTEASYEPTLKDTPILYPNFEYVMVYDEIEAEEGYNSANRHISRITGAINSGDYTEEAVAKMQQEKDRLIGIRDSYNKNREHIVSCLEEFPYATKVWKFFKQNGFSDEVTCAIIGNMMVETSGGELSLVPVIYDPTGDYYGLCQWSLYYNPNVADMSLEEQLDYLLSDMPEEFETFGKCYAKGFTYEDFLNMTDVEEASLAFAKVYERCATFSYAGRLTSAVVAYEYFTM